MSRRTVGVAGATGLVVAMLAAATIWQPQGPWFGPNGRSTQTAVARTATAAARPTLTATRTRTTTPTRSPTLTRTRTDERARPVHVRSVLVPGDRVRIVPGARPETWEAIKE